MIARQYRLRRWKVKKLLNKPESKKIGLFIVKILPNKTKYHRWALTLSRKLAKRAVDRVKKRRQIYEAIRDIQKEQPLTEDTKHYDIALIPLKQILTCNYDRIHQNISEIFTFLNNLK
ncbi:ribonuclease P protein component [Patescibacteria group bacterium]